MSKLMKDLRKNVEFMKYFPSCYLKKLPPRNYFWLVYATFDWINYKIMFDRQMLRITKDIIRPKTTKITAVHLEILKKKENKQANCL